MNKKKALLCLLVFIFSYFHFESYSYANINVSKISRAVLNLKDISGFNYNVYFFAPEEIKSDYYFCGGGDDKVYVGDYTFAIQKQGEKKINMTPIILKGFPYNETQKSVFSIKSKSKSYPDLITVSLEIDCNTKVGYLYYVSKGKLVPLNSSLNYVFPPRFNQKNQIETMNYNNTENFPWVLSTYVLDLKNNSLKFVNSKSFSFKQGQNMVENW
ncbi:hypothetical protein [Bacillus thuringiensis]|uniref:hypothetical protein n=2 Tax=Bacillus TaxID=1386 RepID=UPI000BEE318E|nr:hypothetical protein [Bacillus thuringiensis]MDA2067965.1 hypothetical protein [Bacillus cereus]MDA2079689.1 hypothetical protein [Bacillus cereus]MDA2085351.1 hypothetical protein [Bacillus cereus]PEC13114.1 hypothetical protein CON19_30585 [Bacillus thuringiensis]PGV62293.1 hypothetical protein COD96_28995 [Bacillus thuringiensis]